MAYCAALQKDFGKFREDFELVGTHLSRAHEQVRGRGQAARPLRDEARPAADEQVESSARAASAAARARRRLEPGAARRGRRPARGRGAPRRSPRPSRRASASDGRRDRGRCRPACSVVPSSGQLPSMSLRAAARGTDVRRAVGAILHEQELDATVGCSLQRLLPAGRGAAVPRGLFAPAREQLLLPAGAPLVEQRPRRLEQARRVDVRLGRHPADERRAHLGREQGLESGSSLLRSRRGRPARPGARGRSGRARPPRRAGAGRRSSRCAARSATATSRPGRGGPERPPSRPRAGSARRRGAGRRRHARGRRTRRRAPSPRPTRRTSGAR